MAPKKKEVVSLLSSEAEFRQTVVNDKDRRLHIVDVYSQWCGPCQQIIPTFKSLQMSIDSFDDRLNIVQVERALAKEFVAKYQPSSKPLFLFFKHGVCEKIVEGCSAPVMLKTIDSLIPPVLEDD